MIRDDTTSSVHRRICFYLKSNMCLPVFFSSELDEEAKALQALLSTVGKPVVSIHFSFCVFLCPIITMTMFLM